MVRMFILRSALDNFAIIGDCEVVFSVLAVRVPPGTENLYVIGVKLDSLVEIRNC